MFITRRNPLYLLAPDEPAGGGDDPAPEGTPAATATEPAPTTPEAPEIDWQKRAHDAQAWGTQASQEAAELRQRDELYRQMLTSDDPDERREAGEALGFEFDEAPEPGVDPELARLKREHEELKAWRDEEVTTRQQQQEFDRDVSHVGEGLTSLAKELGRDLTQQEVQLLGDAAWQNRGEDGLPNIAAVIEMAKPMLASQTRQRPRAPHIPAGGEAATHVPQLDTPEQRAAYATQLAAQLEAEELAG